MAAFRPSNPDYSFPAIGLSGRQLQCVTLVGQGMTSKQIARKLGISPSTVDNHIRAVVDRLGAANRIEAARMVILADEGSKAKKISPDDDLTAKCVSTSFTPFRLWHLPPLGGEPNTLGTVARFAHVAQIALLGTMVFAAITATIAGIVNLFR